MQIMLLLLRGMAFLYYQVQILHAAAVFRAGGYNIYPRGVYAAVPQNIGKLCKILFDFIKQPGKQMPQIMWEYLLGADICPRTQRFHFPPDVCSVKRLPQTRYKYHTFFYSFLCSILKQLLPQLLHKENRACFSLAANKRFAAPCRLHRYMLKLAYAYARAA